MTAIIIALVLALGTGGVMYAADESAPGDALYGIDQAMENIQLQLATTEEAQVRIKLRLADERLEEIEVLEEEGDEAGKNEAQVAYGQIVSEIAHLVGGPGGADKDLIEAKKEVIWAMHHGNLEELLASGTLPPDAQATIEATLGEGYVFPGNSGNAPGQGGENPGQGQGEGQDNSGETGQGQGDGQGEAQGHQEGGPGNSENAPGQTGVNPDNGNDQGQGVCPANITDEEAEEIAELADEFSMTVDEVTEVFCRVHNMNQLRKELECSADPGSCGQGNSGGSGGGGNQSGGNG